MVADIDDERASIAREIHDRIAHGIVAAMLRLDLADELDDPAASTESRRIARGILKQTLEDAQSIATGLRHLVRPGSFVATVEDYLGRAVRGARIEHRVTSRGEPGDIGEIAQEHAFLLVREAVRNAVAHAEPSLIEVDVTWLPEALAVDIRDDGSGFELFGIRQGALGLAGMKERAEAIGARLSIVSQIGQGTAVHVEVPYAS